jgi:hypothetical protein
MIDKNGYNYSNFLSDSSDDYPTYEQLISQGNDGCSDYVDSVPYHAKPPSPLIALKNLVNLSKERIHSIKINKGLDALVWDDSILVIEEIIKGLERGNEDAHDALRKLGMEDD